MKKIEKISELSAFADEADDVFMTCHPGNDNYSHVPNRIPRDEILAKREALNKKASEIGHNRYLQEHKESGFLERMFSSSYNQVRKAGLLVREEAFSALPEHVSISPEIAFYLASDQKAYEDRLAKVIADSRSTGNFKGMAIDAALSSVHPTHMAALMVRIPRAWKIMLEDIKGVEKSKEGHDFMVEKIFNVYQLTEIAPGNYALKRGKWGEEKRIASAVAGTWKWVPKVTETGLDPKLDLQRLQKMVDTDKSRN